MGKTCVFLAEGFEEIEALAVVDVLRRNNIEVETISIQDSIYVTGGHKIEVKADKLFDEVNYNDVEMIVLPGGMPGTLNLQKHKKLEELIIKFANENKRISAICAAPSILGKLGILKDKRAICYPGYEKELIGAQICDEAVVIDNNIITSKSMETAIEFGFAIVKQYRK
jgi:4-methyl-5(b-hydroxyethyl)-thiazole monophosphate biosynthesis